MKRETVFPRQNLTCFVYEHFSRNYVICHEAPLFFRLVRLSYFRGRFIQSCSKGLEEGIEDGKLFFTTRTNAQGKSVLRPL